MRLIYDIFIYRKSIDLTHKIDNTKSMHLIFNNLFHFWWVTISLPWNLHIIFEASHSYPIHHQNKIDNISLYIINLYGASLKLISPLSSVTWTPNLAISINSNTYKYTYIYVENHLFLHNVSSETVRAIKQPLEQQHQQQTQVLCWLLYYPSVKFMAQDKENKWVMR